MGDAGPDGLSLEGLKGGLEMLGFPPPANGGDSPGKWSSRDKGWKRPQGTEAKDRKMSLKVMASSSL